MEDEQLPTIYRASVEEILEDMCKGCREIIRGLDILKSIPCTHIEVTPMTLNFTDTNSVEYTCSLDKLDRAEPDEGYVYFTRLQTWFDFTNKVDKACSTLKAIENVATIENVGTKGINALFALLELYNVRLFSELAPHLNFYYLPVRPAIWDERIEYFKQHIAALIPPTSEISAIKISNYSAQLLHELGADTQEERERYIEYMIMRDYIRTMKDRFCIGEGCL